MLFSLALMLSLKAYHPKPIDHEETKRLIEMLDCDVGQTRQFAYKKLLGRGRESYSQLANHWDDPRIEVRESCRNLIERIFRCHKCFGTGQCEECLDYLDNNNYAPCPKCEYSRKCRLCFGKGYID